MVSNSNRIIKVEGVVEESLPGLLFRVKLNTSDNSEKEILAHPSGKMKMYRIKIIPGDKVLIEMPNINDERGRITRRL